MCREIAELCRYREIESVCKHRKREKCIEIQSVYCVVTEKVCIEREERDRERVCVRRL